jgi:hypothetical protein
MHGKGAGKVRRASGAPEVFVYGVGQNLKRACMGCVDVRRVDLRQNLKRALRLSMRCCTVSVAPTPSRAFSTKSTPCTPGVFIQYATSPQHHSITSGLKVMLATTSPY